MEFLMKAHLKKMFVPLVTLTLLTFSCLQSEELVNNSIQSEIYHPENRTTELVLKNGMKVIIKKTDFDPDEVLVQLVAPGGYSDLEKMERPSGMLASKIALQSGISENSANEFSYHLYKNNIDFSITIDKTYRVIDATSPSDSLESILRIIGVVLKENKLTENAYNLVIEKEKKLIRERHLDPEKCFEMHYFALNTQNSKDLRPLSIKGIDKVNLDKSRLLFKKYFTNPSEFTAVIIGDIDVDAVKKMVSQQFSSLEDEKDFTSSWTPKGVEFPEGISRKLMTSSRATDTYTRVTFPITADFKLENIQKVQLLTLLMEKRLRSIIMAETGKTYGVDVGYELPLYPYHETVWLNIQFHCPKNKSAIIEKKIIDEVEVFKENSISEDELIEIVRHQRNNDDFWLKNNSYWQAILLNYSLWGWDISSIQQENSNLNKIQAEDLRKFLEEYVPSNNYTVISSKPS